MIDCLQGLVDLGDACGITPDADAVTLQALGITETFLADITGKEDTPGKLLGQVETWARAYIAADVIRRMGPSAVTHSALSMQTIGDISDDSAPSVPAGYVGGIVVELDPDRSNYTLTIGQAHYTGTLGVSETLTVHDLSDGTQLYTGTLARNNNVNVTVSAPRRKVRLFISHNATGYGYTMLGGSCCGYAYSTQGVTAYGGQMPSASPRTKANVQQVQHGFGLSVTVTTGCDHAQLLCEIRGQMQMPYLYKVGQGIIDRAIQATGRINSTTLDKDMLVARAKQYEAEYQQAMGGVLNAIKIPYDDPCFRCGRRVISAVNLP